jgi:archaellum component FlaC
VLCLIVSPSYPSRAAMSQDPTIKDVLEAVHSLATHMDERFSGVDGRFSSMDEHFSAINDHFSTVDDRFSSIDERFESIDQRFESMDERFEHIDQRFESMDERFEHIDQRFEHIDQRFMGMDLKIEKGFDSIRSEMVTMKQDLLTEIDGLAVLYQKTDLELVASHARADRMETFMVQVGDKVGLTYEPT